MPGRVRLGTDEVNNPRRLIFNLLGFQVIQIPPCRPGFLGPAYFRFRRSLARDALSAGKRVTEKHTLCSGGGMLLAAEDSSGQGLDSVGQVGILGQQSL